MLKNLLAAAFIFAIVTSAHAACSVTYSATNQAEEVIQKSDGWAFKNYEAICNKLNQANAALVITGNGTVLDGKAVAWTTVSIRDKNVYISTSSWVGSSTYVDPYASMPKAEKLLWTTINEAIESLKIDKAIESLNAERQKVRAALSK